MNRPIGIDLGTTFSAVACVDEDGKPRVLPNGEGEFFTPSVVLFGEDGPLVGRIAKESAVAYSDRVVTCVKRHMGSADWAFECDGKAYTPEDVSALILGEMKRTAEQHLGEITKAVITVPAYFLDAERSATIRAAEQAGLKVLNIVNEPTAAALAYGLDEDPSDRSLLVYDLGGGTFDVTIMKTQGGMDFEVVTTQGDHELGGSNWDERLRDHIVEVYLDETKGEDPRLDPVANFDLLDRAEKAKIALSQMRSARVICQHAGKTATVVVTRQDFEKMSEELLALTEREVDTAMAAARLTPDRVDLALLVGGSSKMPMVPALMRTKAREVKMSRDPDHCVALGAALEAARRTAKDQPGTGLYKPAVAKRLGSVRVLDKTPRGLGMLALAGKDLCNTVIIPKGTDVPCELSREDYTTSRRNQDSLTVYLVQGEDRDPYTCVPLAAYDFSGIPPREAGKGRIRVTYRYDENTVVEVDALDLESGKMLVREARALPGIDEIMAEISGEGTEKVIGKRVVALLVDSSGSMAGRGILDAKEACEAMVKKTDHTFVETGLIQFGMGSRASELAGLCRKPKKLLAAIQRLSAGGGTPMARAIELGIEMVNAAPEDADRYIVLFTDGAPNNRDAARAASRRAKESGINILCVGVAGADTSLLDEMATSTEESFFAHSGEELTTTFSNIAQLISDKRL